MKKRNRYTEIKAANRLIKSDIAINHVDVIDVFQGTILKNYSIAITGTQIVGISKTPYKAKTIINGKGKIISPGFIDPHIHIESSYLKPDEFIKTVVSHGTTTTMVDCHELANTNGVEGIEYFLKYTNTPFNLLIWIPSCVPASSWEHNFKELNAKDLSKFYNHPNVIGLGEMMDFFAVKNGKKKVIKKIQDAHEAKLLIDGHFPSYDESTLNAYLSQNITSDHECLSEKEVIEKISRGFHINLRYGDRSKNLLDLIHIVNKNNLSHFSICGDDVNAQELKEKGHLDAAYKAIANKTKNISKIDIIKMMTINTARANKMRFVGGIAPGYRADLVLLDNLDDFNVLKTISNGVVVFENNTTNIKFPKIDFPLSHFNHKKFTDKDFDVDFKNEVEPVITNNKVIKQNQKIKVKKQNNLAVPKKEVAKVSIIDRYNNTNKDNFTCFYKGFGLLRGAIAQTINHDSHNTVVIGKNENDMAIAVNRIKDINGGFVLVDNGKIIAELSLRIGGLMFDGITEKFIKEWEDFYNKTYNQVLKKTTTHNPILELRTLGLTVLPGYRLTLFGLLDVNKNKIIKKN